MSRSIWWPGVADPKIEWNEAGFVALLTSGGVRADVERRANAVAAAAGDGFEAHVYVGGYGGGRVIGSVWTVSMAGSLAEAEDKALSTAVDAGR